MVAKRNSVEYGETGESGSSGSPAPKAPNVVAQGNALGQRLTIFEALKARHSKWCSNSKAFPSSIFRAFSARTFHCPFPGPMAQAMTFRAFGAENQSFH